MLAARLLERADCELEQAMGAIHRSHGVCQDELSQAGTRCARTLSWINDAAGGGRGPAAVRADVLAGMGLAQEQIRAASTPPVSQSRPQQQPQPQPVAVPAAPPVREPEPEPVQPRFAPNNLEIPAFLRRR